MPVEPVIAQRRKMGINEILDTEGRDIAPDLLEVSEIFGLDPIHLLALLFAESNLNPRAERWGSWLPETVRQHIENRDWAALQTVIDDAWPDISFGYSQHIVLFHYTGDRTKSWLNVLNVRNYVFAHPRENIYEAAQKLNECFQHWSCDGSILSAMIVYNAGSDRRDDPLWMAGWSQNVRAYRRALARAENYREDGGDEDVNKAEISRSLGVIWGIAELLEQLKSEYSKELKDAVVAIKQEVGIT